LLIPDDEDASTTSVADHSKAMRLLTASVYNITGLLVETLDELALADVTLVQCLAPPVVKSLVEGLENNIEQQQSTTLSCFKTGQKNDINSNAVGSSISGTPMTAVVSALGTGCQLLLSYLMKLMDTPATVADTNSIENDDIIGNGKGGKEKGVATANNHLVKAKNLCPSTLQLATTFPLMQSLISDSNSRNNTSHSGIQDKAMVVHFRPLDADNSVRHLLSLVGLACIRRPDLRDLLVDPLRPNHGLLGSLLGLPDRYFTVERFKRQLLPTLLSIYKDREAEVEERIRPCIISFGKESYLQISLPDS
jgi:hypothetical protein